MPYIAVHASALAARLLSFKVDKEVLYLAVCLFHTQHIVDHEVYHVGPLLLVVYVARGGRVYACHDVAGFAHKPFVPCERLLKMVLYECLALCEVLPEFLVFGLGMRVYLDGHDDTAICEVESQVKSLDAGVVSYPANGFTVLAWQSARFAFELMPKCMAYLLSLFFAEHNFAPLWNAVFALGDC